VKIVVLAVGKLRDRQLTALCDDYVERASRHVAVEVVEVEDDKALARRWPAAGETIALEVGGESWSTERFAAYLAIRCCTAGAASRSRSAAPTAARRAGRAREPPPVAVGDDAAAPTGARDPGRTDLSRADDRSGRALPPLSRSRAKW
jgi:hypothetical protein